MIHINKFIHEVLSAVPALTALINSKLYILNIPEKDSNKKTVENPVVWFGRAIKTDPYKQGGKVYECIVKMYVHTDSYYEGCNIAEIIIDALDGASSKEYKVQGIYFQDLQDNNSGETDIQEITFKAV